MIFNLRDRLARLRTDLAVFPPPYRHNRGPYSPPVAVGGFSVADLPTDPTAAVPVSTRAWEVEAHEYVAEEADEFRCVEPYVCEDCSCQVRVVLGVEIGHSLACPKRSDDE